MENNKQTAEEFFANIVKSLRYEKHPDYPDFAFCVDKNYKVFFVFYHDLIWCRYYGFLDVLISEYRLTMPAALETVSDGLKYWMKRSGEVLEPFYSISDVLFEHDLKIKGVR